MNFRLPAAFLFCVCSAVALRAADEEPAAPKKTMKEQMRERIAEDAKRNPTPPTTTAAKSDKPATTTPPPPPTAEAPKDAKEKESSSAKESVAKTAQQPATVLPKVEVKKGRITVLDQMLAKQDEEIAREKKNTKSSEVDLALNDSKIAKPLAIFGGDSAQFRKRVASERVELMEAEKDVMEAMARVKTKKERDDLQKQLDELRAMRRELDKSLR